MRLLYFDYIVVVVDDIDYGEVWFDVGVVDFGFDDVVGVLVVGVVE